MNRETSIYLDAIRFTAALAVFFDHIGSQVVSGGFLWRLTGLGAPAVIVFFVLSGWVIAYAVDRDECSPQGYVVARAARIYSVAVPAIILVSVLDAIGRSMNPGLYLKLDSMISFPGHALISAFVSLGFVNEAWSLDITPGTDGPYWSLGYECVYYAIFGLAIFLSGRTRIFSLAAVCLLIGPRVLSLFPLWLLGVWCYRVSSRRPFPFRFGACLCSVTAIAIVALAGVSISREIDTLPVISGHGPKLVLIDYLLGLLFAAHLVGVSAVSSSWRWIGVVAPPIRWLSGATFSLYLYHFPILVFLSATLPLRHESSAFRLALIGVTLALVFLLAEVTERRKKWWRGMFAKAFEWAGTAKVIG